MYKSKLQELCQKRSWELPEYTTVKDGPAHMPRFSGAVNVHGLVFHTPVQCKSAKDAQNTAAQIALDHFDALLQPSTLLPPSISAPAATVDAQFHPVAPLPAVATPMPETDPGGAVSSVLPLSPLPSSLPNPPPGLLQIKNDAKTKPANEEVLQDNCEDSQSSVVNTLAIGSHDKCYKDVLHMYKNQLQQYAQKENLGFPVYTPEAQGPPHARRFKSRVTVDGKTFETSEFFPTLKEAEQAAAKVACQALSVDVIQEDGGLYKNLLQELALKKGFLCPSYETVSSGMSHKPVFMSTVEVGTDTFRGAEAKTKKLAEMNAAKVAYFALKGSAATESSTVSSINKHPVADNLSLNIHHTTTIKKHLDAANDEVHLQTKRVKYPRGNINVDGNHVPSDGPESSTSGEAVSNQIAPSLKTKTVVFPRKLNLQIPEGAVVMPYSDSEWVAYKIELD